MNAVKILIAIISLALMSGAALAKNDKEKSNKGLPPGLHKKVDRGGELPPGWQKKVRAGEKLSNEVYRHKEVVVPIDDKGLVTVRVEGKLIRLIEATREVVEVLE